MSDRETTVAHLRHRVAEFVAARNWEQFHDPKNLSAAIAIETAELMEHFQWITQEQAAVAMQDEAKRSAVADELADVLIYALSLANTLDVDVSDAISDKLEQNERRYPAEKWRGRARGVEG
jgi:NTP pyrophosphatase (non-canonical NTP hydrolase)